MMKRTQSTKHPQEKSREPEWHLVDASGKIAGRLATKIAEKLIGKDKPDYSPHQLSGDYVVVVNAQDMEFTGKKDIQKKYYSHSGYPGNLQGEKLGERMEEEPEEVLRDIISKMLPKNSLRAKMLDRLFIYPDESHSHEAQDPKELEIDNE